MARRLSACICGFVVAVACTVTVGTDAPPSCGDEGTHSAVIDGECVCDEGFERCNPDDEDDETCCTPDAGDWVGTETG